MHDLLPAWSLFIYKKEILGSIFAARNVERESMMQKPVIKAREKLRKEQERFKEEVGGREGVKRTRESTRKSVNREVRKRAILFLLKPVFHRFEYIPNCVMLSNSGLEWRDASSPGNAEKDRFYLHVNIGQFILCR